VERIKQLGEQIGISRYFAVINKTDDPATVKEKLDQMGIPIIGTIPFDKKLIEADLAGLAPVDVGGPAVDEIKKIKDKLENMFGEAAKRQEQ